MEKELAEFRAHVLAYREHFREPTARDVKRAAATVRVSAKSYVKEAAGFLCLAVRKNNPQAAFEKMKDFALGLEKKGWRAAFNMHNEYSRGVFTFSSGPVDVIAVFDSPGMAQFSISHHSTLVKSMLAKLRFEDLLKRSGDFREGEVRRPADTAKILRASEAYDQAQSEERKISARIKRFLDSLHRELGVRKLHGVVKR